jgi:hypothetical protein
MTSSGGSPVRLTATRPAASSAPSAPSKHLVPINSAEQRRFLPQPVAPFDVPIETRRLIVDKGTNRRDFDPTSCFGEANGVSKVALRSRGE